LFSLSVSLNFEFGPKRAAIPVKPNTSLAEALSTFCTKVGLPQEGWVLTNQQRKELDLSLTFRLSGLSSNAKLTLSKKAGGAGNQEVSIALQTPKERLVGKFPPTMSLWDILKYWEKEKNLNFTSDSDIFPDSSDKVYMQPVITYTTKEIGTNEELRNMTLSKLGLTSGNGLIRLCHKYTTIPIQLFLTMDAQNASVQEMARVQEQKIQQQKMEIQEEENAKRLRIENEQIQQEKIIEMEKNKEKVMGIEKVRGKEEEVRSEKEKAQKALNELRQKEKARIEMESKIILQKPPTEQIEDDWNFNPQQIELITVGQNMTTSTLSFVRDAIGSKRNRDDEPSLENEPPPQLSFEERNVAVFAPSSVPFDPRSIDIPDDFYEITKADLRLNAAIQKQKKKEQELIDGKLRTKEMRERDRIKKLSKYKKCFIRIRFPDRTDLQGTFIPLELMNSVYQFVRLCLKESSGDFYLYMIPPKTILKEDNTTNLRDLGFLPACLLYFGIPEGLQIQSPFLKDSIISEIKEKLPPPQIYIPPVVEQSTKIISTPIPVVIPRTEILEEINPEIKVDKEQDEKEKSVPSWFKKGKK